MDAEIGFGHLEKRVAISDRIKHWDVFLPGPGQPPVHDGGVGDHDIDGGVFWQTAIRWKVCVEIVEDVELDPVKFREGIHRLALGHFMAENIVAKFVQLDENSIFRREDVQAVARGVEEKAKDDADQG